MPDYPRTTGAQPARYYISRDRRRMMLRAFALELLFAAGDVSRDRLHQAMKIARKAVLR